ncbi:EsaB/YukD family protein [Bacillus sp. JCM 19034]|uniref:EsaB/YukD family protein n=1 Tax=Bacillus sp. JCM 19034 TaxID=1481928 RepID=UPI000786722D|nr:EsaB/YukD family protein [Bacillus sp. JCM 19034]
MAKSTHINVTIDFQYWDGGVYDLRIPVQVTAKQLLLSVSDTLHIQQTDSSQYAIRVLTKKLLITDDDIVSHYPITDGDILQVL